MIPYSRSSSEFFLKQIMNWEFSLQSFKGLEHISKLSIHDKLMFVARCNNNVVNISNSVLIQVM